MQTSSSYFSSPVLAHTPSENIEQFSQQPGRYLSQVDSGAVALASMVQAHRSSWWLQYLHVLHLRYASLGIVHNITKLDIILSYP